MKVLAALLFGGSALLVGCQSLWLATKETAQDSAWDVIGALIGFLVSSGTPLGVAVGTFIGGLFGRTVHLTEENAALESELEDLDVDPVAAWAQTLEALGWPVVAGLCVVFVLAPVAVYYFGKKRGRKTA